jgi:hypothetical protein
MLTVPTGCRNGASSDRWWSINVDTRHNRRCGDCAPGRRPCTQATKLISNGPITVPRGAHHS